MVTFKGAWRKLYSKANFKLIISAYLEDCAHNDIANDG